MCVHHVLNRHYRTSTTVNKNNCQKKDYILLGKPPELYVPKHKFLYYMEGSGYSMLVGGYKQSEGEGTDGGGIYGNYAAAVAESLH